MAWQPRRAMILRLDFRCFTSIFLKVTVHKMWALHSPLPRLMSYLVAARTFSRSPCCHVQIEKVPLAVIISIFSYSECDDQKKPNCSDRNTRATLAFPGMVSCLAIPRLLARRISTRVCGNTVNGMYLLIFCRHAKRLWTVGIAMPELRTWSFSASK
jgi:hypothetical protein